VAFFSELEKEESNFDILFYNNNSLKFIIKKKIFAEMGKDKM
jgi:hypothetical protein